MLLVNSPANRLDRVGDGPTGDDAEKRQDQEPHDDAQIAEQGPCAALELFIGADLVALGGPADESRPA